MFNFHKYLKQQAFYIFTDICIFYKFLLFYLAIKLKKREKGGKKQKTKNNKIKRKMYEKKLYILFFFKNRKF